MYPFSAAPSAYRSLSFNFSADANRSSRPPMNPLQRSRLLARVAAVTCSASWTDFAFTEAEQLGLDPAVSNLRRALRERGIYPPPADAGPRRLPRRGAVRMRRCDVCGRWTPPINVARHAMVRVCDDCRIEPDTNLDAGERRQNEGVARAPGAHLEALVEGCVGEPATQQEARSRLAGLGLSEQEITVLAFSIAGYSTRRIAAFVRRSQVFVRKLKRSAEQRLRGSGLPLPTPSVQRTSSTIPRLLMRTIDPAKLEAMTSRGF